MTPEQFFNAETRITVALARIARGALLADHNDVVDNVSSERAIVTAFDNHLHEFLQDQNKRMPVPEYDIILPVDGVLAVTITNHKSRRCELFRVSLDTLRHWLPILGATGEGDFVDEDTVCWRQQTTA